MRPEMSLATTRASVDRIERLEGALFDVIGPHRGISELRASGGAVDMSAAAGQDAEDFL